MRMLAGFITPTSGSASICGHDVDERRRCGAKAALGYLPEGAPALRRDDGARFPRLHRRSAPAARARGARTRLAQSSSACSCGACSTQTIETLSKGFRRRVGLAQAIVHDPPVLILDEPTDGLDPNQKHEVRTLINDMAGDKTVIISTHILEEVDAVCTRAIIIARGRIVADDTPHGLAARSRYHNAVSLQLRRAGAAGHGARRGRGPAIGGRRRGERARLHASLRCRAIGRHILPARCRAWPRARASHSRSCTWNPGGSMKSSDPLPL